MPEGVEAVVLTEQQLTDAASVAELDPIFVSVIDLLTGSDAEVRMPNETVDGSAVMVPVTAEPALSRPAPIHCVSTGSPKSSVNTTPCAAEFTSNDLT